MKYLTLSAAIFFACLAVASCEDIPLDGTDLKVLNRLEQRYGEKFKIKKSTYNWQYSQDAGNFYNATGFPENDPGLEFKIRWKMHSNLYEIKDEYLSHVLQEEERKTLDPLIKMIYGQKVLSNIEIHTGSEVLRGKVITLQDFIALMNQENSLYYFTLKLNIFTEDNLKNIFIKDEFPIRNENLWQVIKYLKSQQIRQPQINVSYEKSFFQTDFCKLKSDNTDFKRVSIIIYAGQFDKINTQLDLEKLLKWSDY